MPPKPAQGATTGAPAKKRESKWGKTSSAEPSIIPTAQPAEPAKAAIKENLEIDAHGGNLDLSEDKSIDFFEEEHQDAASHQL